MTDLSGPDGRSRREAAADGSESARIAALGAGCRLFAFGFWTGELPPIARLHFVTVARALPAGSRYVLFVEGATISDEMQALLASCNIEVVTIDLRQLMRENGVGRLLPRMQGQGAWKRAWQFAGAHPRLASLLRLGHAHRVRGFTPRYNLLLGAPPLHAVLVANYARVMISGIVKTATLYTDLDFAFARPLDWVFDRPSFVYRWQNFRFANNALIFARGDCPVKSGELLRCLKKAGTGRAWILFSEKNCRACGLEILPCDRLDPLWAMRGSYAFSDFLAARSGSPELLSRLRNEFDAVHWHNQWKAEPEPGSPYDLWMRDLMARASAGEGRTFP